MQKDVPAATQQPKKAEARMQAAAPEQGASAPAAPETKKTPAAWAEELGHVRARRLAISLGGTPAGSRYSSEHRRAATCHGWDANDARGFAPIFLSRKDYEKAIAGASAGKPHEPALAPFMADALKKERDEADKRRAKTEAKAAARAKAKETR